MTLNNPMLLAILSLVLLLAGCNAEVAPTDPPSRKLIQDIVFEDANLAACVQMTRAIYVDELADLGCFSKGIFGEDNPLLIRSTKGLEKLTALENINFVNQAIKTFDGATFPKLKSLSLNGNPLREVSLSQNAQLRSLYLDGDNTQNQQQLIVDLRGNLQLETLFAGLTKSLLLPKSHSLQKLSFRIPGNLTAAQRAAFSGVFADAGNGILNLDLSSYTELKLLDLRGQFGEIKLPESASLEEIFIGGANTVKIGDIQRFIDLKALALPLDSSIQEFDVSGFKKLQTLSLLAPGLRNIDLSKNEVLENLTLDSEVMTSLDLTRLPRLHQISLNIPKVHSLNLEKNTDFSTLNIGSGELETLSGLNSYAMSYLTVGANRLTDLDMGACNLLLYLSVGDNQLTKLDTTRCGALNYLYLGANKIRDLNLSGNYALSWANLANPIEPSHLQLAENLDPSLVHNPAITELPKIANLNIPDVKLRTCITQAAQEQGVVFAKDLKRLECAGTDDKVYWQSLSSYASLPLPGPDVTHASETARWQVAQHVFSIEGLEQLTGLEYLDLSVNWIDSINLNVLPNLKVVKLDGNVIQHLNISVAITSLSIDSNPLLTLTLPESLKSLSANKRIKFIYTPFALNDRVELPRMKSLVTQKNISEEDYRTPLSIANLDRLIFLVGFNAG